MHLHPLAALLVGAGVLAAQSPFGQPYIVDLGPHQRFLSAGDVNSDALPDAIVTQQDGSLMLVLSQGAGAFAAPTPVFSLSGTNRTALADVDLDGDLDILACIDGTTQELLSMRRGNGDGTFAPNAIFNPVNAGPADLEVGDLDADGSPDVLVACLGSARLSRLMGHGDGTFAPAVDVPVAVNVRGVALGHLDGDDDLDAAAITSGGLLFPLLNNGAGTLAAGATQPIATNGRDVDLGDVDADGDDDALMGFNDNQARFALCLGDGSFAPPVVQTLDTASPRPEIVDVNEDGLGDCLHGSQGIVDFLSLGGGAFGPIRRFGVVHGVTDHATADFTGDGDLDVLVTEQLPFVSSHGVLLTGDGTGSFGPVVLTGDGPNELAAGDLNGDGRTDIVVAGTFDNTVRVHLGLPHGLFSGAVLSFPGGSAPWALALGDVDEDGVLDAVVANDVFPGTVSILFGDGTGALSAPQPLALATTPYDLVLRDLNADGHLDLGVVGQNATLAVLWGDGSGGFAPHQTLATAAVQAGVVETAELNGDGLPDLLVGNELVGIVNVYLSEGGGQYAEPLSFPLPFKPVTGLASGDLDHDGDADVLAASDDGAVLFLNDGTGFLVAQSTLDLAHAAQVELADVTRDGELDIVGVSYDIAFPQNDLGLLSVLAGHGDGSFDAPLSVKTSALANDLIVQDLDGDAVPDAAMVSFQDDLAVRLNQLGPWHDLGHPLAGAQGLPRQFGSGSLQPGAPFAIEIADARPNGVTSHVIGITTINKAFKGGVYVPAPLLINYPLPLDAQGGLVLAGNWPLPAVPGLDLYFQFWTPDPAGIKGWSATNALRATLP